MIGNFRSALILGATSDIAHAIARRLAAGGLELTIAGRDTNALERNARDLRARHGSSVQVRHCDVRETASIDALVAGVDPFPDLVVCAVGYMPDAGAARVDPAVASAVFDVNFNGPARFLEIAAGRLEARGSGALVAISSVAGERGRASNYHYGAAKAALTTFLSGLRNRFAATGIRVITVKPGFVSTRMTSGMDLPPALTVEPDDVARALVRALKGHTDVVYVKWIWSPIMVVIRLLPEWIFKRTRL